MLIKITISAAKSGESLNAKYAGRIRTCEEVDYITIFSVAGEILYVFGLHLNLFTISRQEEKGLVITFVDGKAEIKKDDQTDATEQWKCGRLYQLNFTLKQVRRSVVD